MPDNIKALRGYIKDRVLYGDSAFFATEDAESCADEIERLRAALREIASIDYRGNAHPSASIARGALREKE